MGLEQGQGRFKLHEALLTSQSAATAGRWVDTFGMHPFSVTVSGSFVGTVKILVSNAPTKPSDSETNHPQLGSDITAPEAVSADLPFRWVKAQVSAYTSGSVSAAFLGVTEAHRG